MNIFKVKRCGICKERRGTRFCLRKGKDICWWDCNRLRVDLKCPESCSYALRKTDNPSHSGMFHYQTKSDSQMEFKDLLICEMDKWMHTPQRIFKDQIPLEMVKTSEGKQQIESLFQGIKLPSFIPLDYLAVRLKLENLKLPSPEVSYEEIAGQYLDQIIAQNWKGMLEFHHNQSHYQDGKYADNFIFRTSKSKLIKRIKHYDLISSALSEDKKRALVYFDINYGKDLTVVLKKDNTWQIQARIFGKPELVNGENEAIQQVALLLSKNYISKVLPLLKKFINIYFDSSDMYYYYGLYYTFVKNRIEAEKYFLSAVELDPDFNEAKYNYAYILHGKKQLSEAKQLYKEILVNNPKDIKSLNNLGSIYLEQGNTEIARRNFSQCLKIDPEFELAKKNLERIGDN